MVVTLLSTILIFYLLQITETKTIYVSPGGSDANMCSSGTCGTLYTASGLITQNVSRIIVNGQNEAEISNIYTMRTDNYHPCLPKTFHTNIEIEFNCTNMICWYPSICANIDIDNSTKYINKYMFEVEGGNLSLNNLHIDHHKNNIPFGIMSMTFMDRDTEANLICIGCTFKNIVNDNHIDMIYSTRNVKIINSSFVDIQSISNFIVMLYGKLNVLNVLVADSTFNQSFITIVAYYGNRQFSDKTNLIILSDSEFKNIQTSTSIINDEWISSHVKFNYVNFTNINYGSIWTAKYKYGSSVHMTNIFISTSQLLHDNNYPLLSFNYATQIFTQNMVVQYYYNIYANCYNVSNYAVSQRMNASYLLMDCMNPVSLISNYETITLTDTIISINISQNDINTFKHEICPKCDFVQMTYSNESGTELEDSKVLISNYGSMNINRLSINGFSFCRRIFQNEGSLHITEFSVDNYNGVDPNTLQSWNIIIQSRKTAELIIYDSVFIGGTTQIVIYDGSIQIYNSTFQHATKSLNIESGKDVVIYGCDFYHIGRYYGTFKYTTYRKYGDTRPVLLMTSVTGINIESNIFNDCFDDYGKYTIIGIKRSTAVILKNNYFAVDNSNLYYKLTPDRHTRIKYMWAVVYIEQSDTSIIGNNFVQNDVYPEIPWIQFWDDLGKINCLSANNFTNFAFQVKTATTITSCFRPDIANCFKKLNKCSDGVYGNMNTELNQQISHFNVDVNFIQSIFTIIDSATVALDNIQINVVGIINSSNYSKKPLVLHDSNKAYTANILILDSILLPYHIDIWYNEACNVIANHRLVNKSNYIAKAMIMCNRTNPNNTILNLRNSLNFVDHFSATRMRFNPESPIYYPGKKLPFYWEIWDSLDNKIHTSNYSSKLTINLESSDFDFLQSININETGDCGICKSGVMIQSITFQHVLNSTNTNSSTDDFHILTASIPDETLLLINDSIHLQLTLCPKGHGPDSSKFLCDECNDGTFNLKEHNSEPCHSCNEDDGGIKCYGGNIYISRNYWSGVSDDYRSIVTQQCPADYCCIEKQCNFENKSLLCAANRDPDTPFCGRCMTGYSQSMNSTKCTICLGNDYLWLFPAFMLSLVITFYLISCHSYSRHNQAKQDMQDNSADKERQGCIITILRHKEYMLMIKTFGARILLYYFQAITQVIWPSTIAVYIYTFASLFDLTINLGETGSGQWCFVEGLTTKQKILATGIPTLFIMGLCIFMCAWIYLLHYFGCEYNFKCCFKCFGKSIIRCRPCNTNFARVFVVMLLICVGQILSILFRLLNCQQIGSSGIYIHIYFGEEECLKTFTFYGALIGLFIVIIIFALMFAKLYKMSKQDRNDINQPLNSFCRYYEEQYYWWESVILSRRILIALLAMFYNNYYYMTMVVIVLLLFL
eukprot:299464_1